MEIDITANLQSKYISEICPDFLKIQSWSWNENFVTFHF